MKSALLAALVLMMTVSSLSAEICVKHHTHTDEYYYGGTTTPEVNRNAEIWFGEGKLAYVHERVKMIFDVSGNTLTFINSGDSIYMETTLPPTWENIIVEEEVPRLKMYQYTGEMKDLGETKEIDGHQCAGYMLTTWIPYEDILYNETDEVAWYTEDVPFDLDLYRKVYPCLLLLRNYNPELIESLGGGTGYPVRSESTRYQKGIEIKTVNTIEEIVEVDAPEGLWTVPEGFTRKDRLTINEIRGY
jgi:hypothetical protein